MMAGMARVRRSSPVKVGFGEAKISGAKFDDGDRIAACRLKAPIALKPFGN